MQELYVNFDEWLESKKDEDTRIGDLARDYISAKEKMVDDDDFYLTEGYLMDNNACQGALLAYYEAKLEYEKYHENFIEEGLGAEKIQPDIFKVKFFGYWDMSKNELVISNFFGMSHYLRAVTYFLENESDKVIFINPFEIEIDKKEPKWKEHAFRPLKGNMDHPAIKYVEKLLDVMRK